MMKKLVSLLLAVLLCLGCACAGGEGLEDDWARLDAVLQEKGDGMGMWVAWSTEELRPWAEALGVYGTLQDQVPEGWISREEAESISRQAVLALDEMLYPQCWYGVREPEALTRETVDALQAGSFAAAQNEEGMDVWYVFLYDAQWLKDLLDCYEVILDAHTGEVLTVMSPGGNG